MTDNPVGEEGGVGLPPGANNPVGRVGFAGVVGRPNVGKSTLVNAMVGRKVTITSPRPNTTRWQVRGIVHRPDGQVVLVDTPGLHRPRTPLGTRLNESAAAAFAEVDVVVAVVDATAAIGPGDRRALELAVAASAPDGNDLVVAVNKIDRAGPGGVLERLATASAAVRALREDRGLAPEGDEEYFPVSATTGEGVAPLVDALVARLPEGHRLYPPDLVRDTPEAMWVAELVREQLLAQLRQELPHAIACRVTEWEWPRIRCEILVERDSQKGIVIGRGGAVLKAVGTAVRQQLPPGAHLELFVRVERSWQRRDDALDRLGI